MDNLRKKNLVSDSLRVRGENSGIFQRLQTVQEVGGSVQVVVIARGLEQPQRGPDLIVQVLALRIAEKVQSHLRKIPRQQKN
jgi:hypothetical protein